MSKYTKLRTEFKTFNTENAIAEMNNQMSANITTQPIGQKIKDLFNKIPSSGYPIKEETIETYKNLNLEGREDLVYAIDVLVDNLKGHIEQWEGIRARIKNDKEGIQRIK